MTPTPREDTMTEQTEQEQIDPIARCIQWLSFMVTNAEDRRIVQAELESIRSAHQQETSRLLAALSTVDSQIHQQAELLAQRWDTVERLTKQHNEWKAQAEQHAAHLREQIARLKSVLLEPEMDDSDASLLTAAKNVCANEQHYREQVDTLRAERDAAQQEIAELKRALMGDARYMTAIAEADVKAMQQQIATLTEALKRIENDMAHTQFGLRAIARVALQSTRPQEQP